MDPAFCTATPLRLQPNAVSVGLLHSTCPDHSWRKFRTVGKFYYRWRGNPLLNMSMCQICEMELARFRGNFAHRRWRYVPALLCHTSTCVIELQLRRRENFAYHIWQYIPTLEIMRACSPKQGLLGCGSWGSLRVLRKTQNAPGIPAVLRNGENLEIQYLPQFST